MAVCAYNFAAESKNLSVMDYSFALLVILIDVLSSFLLTYILVGFVYNSICNDFGIEWSNTVWTISTIITDVVFILGILLLCKFIEKKLTKKYMDKYKIDNKLLK
mgnify:CR=1 FL=1